MLGPIAFLSRPFPNLDELLLSPSSDCPISTFGRIYNPTWVQCVLPRDMRWLDNISRHWQQILSDESQLDMLTVRGDRKVERVSHKIFSLLCDRSLDPPKGSRSRLELHMREKSDDS
jgi:hypothetical protein